MEFLKKKGNYKRRNQEGIKNNGKSKNNEL